MILPITLLDMVRPESITDYGFIEEYALKGTSVSCEPFDVRNGELPDFLGGFKFK